MTNPKAVRKRLFVRDGWKAPPLESGGRKEWMAWCAFDCGTLLTWDTATIDHYPIPRRMGGGWGPENTRLACQPCNSSDGGKAGGANVLIPPGLTPVQRKLWWQSHAHEPLDPSTEFTVHAEPHGIPWRYL